MCYFIRKQFTCLLFCRSLIFFLQKDLADKYALSKLQRRLQKYYGDAVGIQKNKGQGKFNIILSNSITIAEAIHSASQMKSELNLLELKNDISNMQMNEDQILHRAASILRYDIQSVQISSDVTHHQRKGVLLKRGTENETESVTERKPKNYYYVYR